MHSLALAENLLQAVLSEALKHEGKQITSVYIKLEDHDFAEEESVRFCFEALSSGTAVERAKLIIEPILEPGPSTIILEMTSKGS